MVSGHAWRLRTSCDINRVRRDKTLLGWTHAQRAYCRLVLRCFGVRITMLGNPICNLGGVLVISSHIFSWMSSLSALCPGSFVARADMASGPAIAIVARILNIIPIEWFRLRRLPKVVRYRRPSATHRSNHGGVS